MRETHTCNRNYCQKLADVAVKVILLVLKINDNFLCTRYVLKSLQPGEAVVIVDYKMKLELGVHSREIQRDWYGKQGISLYGCYVIAQVGVDERRIEVLDLWSEDTKQDSWFTQSALDVGFAWLEKVFLNFHVYLF